MNSSINKKLVFHFYGGKHIKNQEIIDIHIKCLKYYANIFDEALFVITYDDDVEEASEIAKRIFSINFKKLTIRKEKNTVFREALTFKTEIVDKIDELNHLVFFGHSKGLSNTTNDKYGTNCEVLKNWVLGMYFLNLDNIEDVIYKIYNDRQTFYGAYLTHDNNRFIYSGTFYWLNIDKFKGKKINNYMYDLAYAEDFPSYFEHDNNDVTLGHNLASYRYALLFKVNLYNNDRISFLTDGKITDFLNFKEKILTDEL